MLDEGGTTSADPLFRTFSMNFINCFFFLHLSVDCRVESELHVMPEVCCKEDQVGSLDKKEVQSICHPCL